MANERLPEGTDAIVSGNGDLGGASSATGSVGRGTGPASTGASAAASSGATGTTASSSAASEAGSFKDQAREKLGAKASELKGQAGDKARDYAEQGKERAASALDGVSKLFEDGAQQIDDKVGAQYGDYARQAAQAIAGFSTSLRDSDVDELFEQARDTVRKSPAIAIGAAAALGFVVARIIKAGADSAQAAADELGGTAPKKPKGGAGLNA